MDAAWLWKEWEVRSKIFLAAWIELVTAMIFETSLEFVAWLIPHLMVKISASVLVMFTAWCRVLVIDLLWMWVCEMEVAILFLMLVSVMTRACEGILKDLITKLSSCWIWALQLLSLCLLDKWKEKQLEKMSMTLCLGENSGWRGTKEGNTSLKWLSISTNGSLINSR